VARNNEEGKTVLWTIFVILLVLWLLGMVSSYTLGGYIHILLILAIAVVLIRVIQGRRPVL
jgi:asparagine N-glycosylation enzyme membrane subunit Stt3